ncbi:MAG: hypothetical protein WB715_09935 [Roseiarcus sp.]|uniref:hypothetical protein n=1 Tax=Roseiarcus sp. TaxID=1969460 RepID=UPI003C5B29ED
MSADSKTLDARSKRTKANVGDVTVTTAESCRAKVTGRIEIQYACDEALSEILAIGP